jgi:hypothetical protein
MVVSGNPMASARNATRLPSVPWFQGQRFSVSCISTPDKPPIDEPETCFPNGMTRFGGPMRRERGRSREGSAQRRPVHTESGDQGQPDAGEEDGNRHPGALARCVERTSAKTTEGS